MPSRLRLNRRFWVKGRRWIPESTELRYDFHKLKSHDRRDRLGRRYFCRLTTGASKPSVLFIVFPCDATG
jgi:hypothetical protein